MSIFFYPYKMGSKSCKALSRCTGILRTTNPRLQHINIYWGHVTHNKRKQAVMAWLANIPSADWTTKKSVAQEWNNNHTIFVRHALVGFSGAGIEIVPPNKNVPQAPLYTKEFPKEKEFRVHMFMGKPHLVVEKRRRNFANPSLIWNHKNNYVFCHNSIDENHKSECLSLATMTWEVMGQPHACCVDIMYGDGKYIVGKLNTAPGIKDSHTLNSWREAVETWITENVTTDTYMRTA